MARRLLLSALVLLAAACSQKSEDDRQKPAGTSKVALWEVADASGARGWIFGTVHALPDGTRWRRAEVDRALSGADRLVLEIGEPLDSDVVGEALARLAITPGLPPPSARIGADSRDALRGAYSAVSMSDKDFAGVESWAVALQIAAVAGRAQGTNPDNGVEPELRRMAAGKPVAGLETVDGQFGVFDRLPERQQTILLEQVATEASSGASSEDNMLSLWLAGDEPGMSREAGTGFLADPALRESVLTARNRDWAGQIDAMLRSGARPFVAVGAAHTVGGDGLPAMLAAKGWRVRRVP